MVIEKAIHYETAKGLKTYRFFKENEAWFIDLPAYIEQGGDMASLEMKEGADEILQIISRGKNSVSIFMDTEPFENADMLELDELCPAPKGGGYYVMHTCRGKAFNRRLWICDITLFVFGDMPQHLYVLKCTL